MCNWAFSRMSRKHMIGSGRDNVSPFYKNLKHTSNDQIERNSPFQTKRTRQINQRVGRVLVNF
jgi:hypothetical protein